MAKSRDFLGFVNKEEQSVGVFRPSESKQACGFKRKREELNREEWKE